MIDVQPSFVVAQTRQDAKFVLSTICPNLSLEVIYYGLITNHKQAQYPRESKTKAPSQSLMKQLSFPNRWVSFYGCPIIKLRWCQLRQRSQLRNEDKGVNTPNLARNWGVGSRWSRPLSLSAKERKCFFCSVLSIRIGCFPCVEKAWFQKFFRRLRAHPMFSPFYPDKKKQ